MEASWQQQSTTFYNSKLGSLISISPLEIKNIKCVKPDGENDSYAPSFVPLIAQLLRPIWTTIDIM
jgi:hypothetical protein